MLKAQNWLIFFRGQLGSIFPYQYLVDMAIIACVVYCTVKSYLEPATVIVAAASNSIYIYAQIITVFYFKNVSISSRDY